MSLLDTGYDNYANWRKGLFVVNPIGGTATSQQAIEPGYNNFGVQNSPFNYSNDNLIPNVVVSPKQPSESTVSTSRYVIFRVVSSSTSNFVATKVGGDLEMPIGGTISEIGAFVDTAGFVGSETIDVNLNGSTLMSTTKITIETGEKSSRNASIQPVLTTTSVSIGDIITVDIDAVQTQKAKGLTVRFTVT